MVDDPPQVDDPRISIGLHTYGLQRKSFLLWQPDERIEIGSFCSFAKEVLVFGGGEHFSGVTTYPLQAKLIDPGARNVEATSKGPTRIGSDCWVGRRAMILSGVTVGDGAVIGAGAVVAGDVPPYAVVAGNPARVLRMRFDEETVERLLAVRWWEWDDQTIARRGHLFSDIERFLAVADEDGDAAPAHAASEGRSDAPRTPRDLYLDLLRDALLGLVAKTLRTAKRRKEGGVDVLELDDAERRIEGRDWPADADSMIGALRLDNVRACVEHVIEREVPGDLIEAGVWRGGATILMRGILAAHGVTDRRVWVADSFAGLPRPDAATFPADEGDRHHRHRFLAVSEEEVRGNFDRYGLLDQQVQFLPGWFRQTLPTLAEERFAVVRLDGDMYESTILALEHLYPRLSVGGYLIVDDYGALPTCRKAVEDYRLQHGVEESIRWIDWTGVFWCKER
jgi:O-methyltransferase